MSPFHSCNIPDPCPVSDPFLNKQSAAHLIPGIYFPMQLHCCAHLFIFILRSTPPTGPLSTSMLTGLTSLQTQNTASCLNSLTYASLLSWGTITWIEVLLLVVQVSGLLSQWTLLQPAE